MNIVGSGARVLVVDDEPTVREVVASYLRRDGHIVSEAADGPTALALLESESPDLVVLDMMLPGINGLDILRRIRQMGDMPVIMLTARAEESDRVAGLELGADDYVVKPAPPPTDVVSNPAPPPTDVVLKMTSLQIVDAQTSSGDVTSLGADDDSNELLLASRRQGKNEVTAFEASGSATVGVVTKLDISFEPHQTTSGVSQKLLLWNVQSAAWESVWSTSAPTTATAPLTVTVSGDPNRFVSPAGQVRARVESRAKGSSHQMGVDVLWFTLKQN